jgi:hypothetical protein
VTNIRVTKVVTWRKSSSWHSQETETALSRRQS